MRILQLALITLFATPANAQQECVDIDDDALRLSCYDQKLGRRGAAGERNLDSEEISSDKSAAEVPPKFSSALSSKSPIELIEAVHEFDNVDKLPEEMRDTAIEIIVRHVRPLPAANAEANRDGYAALAALDPSNSTYSRKATRYAKAVEEKRSSILRRMKKKTDEFNGNVFYEHPSTPRYTDTRSYLAVYAGQNNGIVWLRMRLNYTNDSWLFIKNAALNIDGETIKLPYADWKRDNDSEIWEWIDVGVDIELRRILRKIAASKSTIVRFNGQKYYDNVTIREADKQVIRDMFVLEDVLKSQ